MHILLTVIYISMKLLCFSHEITAKEKKNYLKETTPSGVIY